MKIKYIKIMVLLILLASCNGKTVVAESSPDRMSDADYKVTFLELGSVKCVPCQAMVPVMEQIKNELGDQVDVVFHDVWTDEGKPVGQEYRIRVIPTQIFLDKNGDEYFRHEGYFPIEELYAVLEQGGVKLQ